MNIGDKNLGVDGYVFIIAEAGVNHNGSLDMAKKMVDAAKEAGVDAVKFQTFETENIVTKEVDMASYQQENVGKQESQFDMLKKLELKYDEFRELKQYCDEKEIMFLSTPHTPKSLNFLNELVPANKIASGDVDNLPFLESVAKKGKPIILSTGMANLDEVKEAVDVIRKYNDQIVVLHCTTNYPCPREDVNLKAMVTMKDELSCLVGYSDHTLGIDVPLMAVSLGATVIEKHFTLDKNMEGPDHKASLDPSELKEMVQSIRDQKKVEIPKTILGSGVKEPTPSEVEIAKVARKSIITTKKIPLGTVITEDMLIIKRPGTGIKSKELGKILGKKAKRDIPLEQVIEWDDIDI